MANIISSICIVLLAISVVVISFGLRHFVVKLNERIDDIKFDLENLDARVSKTQDVIQNQWQCRYIDGSLRVKTVRGRLDDLTEDIDLLKEYLKVEKVDTPASTKFVKRKGE